MEEALALTWKTMTDRLRNLRLGSLASLLSMALLAILAIVFRTGWVLTGLPAILMVGAAFVHREQRLLFAWEDRVLALWGESNLCMGIFVQTLANHPHALRRSLKSMVAHMPANPDFITPPMDHITAYRRVFWTRSLLQDIRFRRAAALNAFIAVLPFTLSVAYGKGGAFLILGLTPLCMHPLAHSLSSRLLVAGWRKRMEAMGKWSGDGEPLPDYAARIDALDWSRIPDRLKRAIRAEMLSKPLGTDPHLSRQANP